MKKKKGHRTVKKIALGAAAALAGTALLWTTFGNNFKVQTPAYTVWKVFDGDTFDLTNGMKIRLNGIDSPEINRCGGPEAKRGLEKLIIGKPLYVYVSAQDIYRRNLAIVYTDEIMVNAEMLRYGYSSYSAGNGVYNNILREAVDEARSKNRGIYGTTCTQKENTQNPSCNIKGNNEAGNKYFFTPLCNQYNETIVQLYLGDQWFCTEKEAINAGYKKAPRCGKN